MTWMQSGAQQVLSFLAQLREYQGNWLFPFLPHFLQSFPEYSFGWAPDMERNGIFGLSNSILGNAILLLHCAQGGFILVLCVYI